jgi:hypothetical protein
MAGTAGGAAIFALSVVAKKRQDGQKQEANVEKRVSE